MIKSSDYNPVLFKYEQVYFIVNVLLKFFYDLLHSHEFIFKILFTWKHYKEC